MKWEEVFCSHFDTKYVNALHVTMFQAYCAIIQMDYQEGM